jgi:hypothetical protein
LAGFRCAILSRSWFSAAAHGKLEGTLFNRGLLNMNARNFIFDFEDGDGKNKMLLGGKGANLCEMTQIGLNVPPGFVVTTEACLAYLEKNQLPEGLMDDVRARMKTLEKKTGKGFGSADNPLLVSVRSGSAMSMPGMMDTILNLGLNETSLKGLIKQTGNARFAWDAYRRFIQLFGKIALGIADPTSSWKSRWERCSAPGWASAPWITAASSRSPRTRPTARR